MRRNRTQIRLVDEMSYIADVAETEKQQETRSEFRPLTGPQTSQNQVQNARLQLYLVAHGQVDLRAVEGSLEDARPFPESQLLHDVLAHLIWSRAHDTLTLVTFISTCVLNGVHAPRKVYAYQRTCAPLWMVRT